VYLGTARSPRPPRRHRGLLAAPLGAQDLLVRRDAVLDVGLLQSLQGLHHRKELGHVVVPATATGTAVEKGGPGGTAVEKGGPRWRRGDQEEPQ